MELIAGVLRPPVQARIRATVLGLVRPTTMERARNVAIQEPSARIRIIVMVAGHAQIMATRPMARIAGAVRPPAQIRIRAMERGPVWRITMGRVRFVEHLLAPVTKPNTVMVEVHARETVFSLPRPCVGLMLANVMFPNTALAHQHLARQTAMRKTELYV